MVFSDGKPAPHISNLSKCSNCSTIYKTITPSWHAIVADNYTSDYKASPNTNEIKPGAHLRRIEQVTNKINFDSESSIRVLDYGMGNGDLSKYIITHFKNVLVDGYDPFLHDVGTTLVCSEYFTRYSDMTPLFHSRSKSYDYIVLLQSFEHISDPLSVLNNLLTLLKDDGKIFIQIPCPYLNPVDLVVYDHSFHFGLNHHSIDYFQFISIDLSARIELSNHKEVLITLCRDENNSNLQFSERDAYRSLLYIDPLKSLYDFTEKCHLLDKSELNIAILGNTYSSLWAQQLFSRDVVLFTTDSSLAYSIIQSHVIILPFPKYQADTIASRLDISTYISF